MSNKPKIRAFCAAGCAWETVHKEDFLKSATFYEVGQPDGYATVDAYRKYRIFSDSNTNTGKYTATIEFQSPDATGEAYDTQMTFSVSTGYRGYFDFEIMQARYNGAMLYIAYEVNGEEMVSNINLATTEHDLTKSVLKITGANQVLIYNDTAAIVGKDGGYYTPIVKDNGNGTVTISYNPSEEGMPEITPVTFVTGGSGGGGTVNDQRHAVVVNVIGNEASHSAQAIFDLMQYGSVVVAQYNARYCYPYKRVITSASGAIERCEFAYTDVTEEEGIVTTHYLSIDNEKNATLYRHEITATGTNTMTDTETGKTYTLTVTGGKLILTEVS